MTFHSVRPEDVKNKDLKTEDPQKTEDLWKTEDLRMVKPAGSTLQARLASLWRGWARLPLLTLGTAFLAAVFACLSIGTIWRQSGALSGAIFLGLTLAVASLFTLRVRAGTSGFDILVPSLALAGFAVAVGWIIL